MIGRTENVRTDHAPLRSERGAALIVSLVMLLVLTLIAVSGASSANFEMLMAGNTQTAMRALADAEDSVFFGEREISINHADGGPSFDFDDEPDDGFYTLDDIEIDGFDWTQIGHQQVLDDDGEVRNQFVIEYLGPAASAGGSLCSGCGSGLGTRYLYRVTGLGTAGDGGARIVQTIYATL